MKFVDLNMQYELYKNEIDRAIQGVINSSQFINGDEVKALERDLCEFSGNKFAIACSSGTDALVIPQIALNIKPEDEIIVPAFTYFATASMVSHWGATPVFVDIDPVTYNIDPSKIRQKITDKTKAIFAVSLYGQPANYDEINEIASENDLWVLEDGAQSFGAEYKNKKSCNLTHVATTSFFPAKPLGCYGDGGALFTNDEELSIKLRKLINHGQDVRYKHKYIGVNARMDTIQAAILRVKLKYFNDELTKRQEAADYYTKLLDNSSNIVCPQVLEDRTSSWAQYSIKIPNRDIVRKKLHENGIPTSVHYPMPLNRQEAFTYLNDNTHYDVAEETASSIISLPMHAFISKSEQDQVVESLKELL